MKILNRTCFAIASAVLVTANFGLIPSDAWAGNRGGGGGHTKTSVHKDVNANRNKNVNVNSNVNRNQNVNVNSNRNVNKNVNVNSNRNVNRNVNVNSHHDIDIDVDVDRRYHPVATGVAVGMTAAAIGSVIYTLPPSCTIVRVGAVSYQQCGSVWYEPRYVAGSVQYVVVGPPR
jgi:uncharacterized protein YdeI (BOF family)